MGSLTFTLHHRVHAANLEGLVRAWWTENSSLHHLRQQLQQLQRLHLLPLLDLEQQQVQLEEVPRTGFTW